MLVNVRTVAIDQRRERRKIFPRMEACLSGKLNPWAVEEWSRTDKGGLEAERGRQRRFLPKPIRLTLGIAVQCRELVARNPRPVAIDRFPVDDRVDLGNRCETGVPDGLRMIASEIVNKAGEIAI